MRPTLTLVPGDGYAVQIMAAMAAAGIETPPAQIVADGRVHRFASTPGRNGATGWYVVHPDPVAPMWSFGDWRLDIKQRGEPDPGRVLDPSETADRKQRLHDLRVRIAAEEARFQAGAAIEARQRWDRCGPAAAHGYLKSKGIDPCGTRVDGDSLLVPMRDIDGKLWSLQEIAGDGRKHNQEGGKRKGCFFQIGEIGETFCVGEGFSTCASVHMATGYAVVSVGEAGNLERVAKALREKYPAATVVICGDDDWLGKIINGKTRNVGRTAATKAAEAVGGVLALPWFGPARPAWATDFNDMAKLSGLDEVATRIKLDLLKSGEDQERARAAEPPPPNGPEDFGLPGSVTAACSDDALALRFAGVHAAQLRFVAPWGRWLEWDGSHWTFDERLRCFDLTRKICREAAAGANEHSLRRTLASAKTVAAVERLARSDQRLAATTDQWDADLWKLNTPAGAVDLHTGILAPSTPDSYAIKITAAAPGGACPLWRAFIVRITAGDAALAAFIQRMLGYFLTGSTQEHALFFLYGTGANGKSVLVKTAASILGDYHTTAPIETFTASQGERHPTELAALRGARLVSSVETQQGRKWDETKIKVLTGGDEVSARFMRQDFFEFTPQFKLIIAGNHKPGLRNVDEAIRRRFHLVPFAVTIPLAERDQGLTEALKKEWPGILAWMIEGCLDWQRRGLDPPAAVRDATAAYLEAEDAIASWFGECCERDPQSWETSAALFGSWVIWATRAGEPVGSQKAFVQNLENRDGFRPFRRETARGFSGLRLTPTYYGEQP